MRRLELTEGTPVETSDGKRVGLSKVAAREGIAMVTLSRIGMAAPGMVLIPVIVNNLERKGLFRKYPRLSAPLQVLLCGLILTVQLPCVAQYLSREPASASLGSNQKYNNRLRTMMFCFTTRVCEMG